MNNTLPSEQEVDQLLDAFFKNEMPHPWPAFEPPLRRTLPFRAAAPRRRFVLGSKVALAASVALLMVCGWLLSGSFDAPRQSGTRIEKVGPGDAEKDKGNHQGVPMPKDDDPEDNDFTDLISR